MLEPMLAAAPDLVALANPQGWRPIHYASGFGHPHCIDLLLKHGATLNSRNETSTTFPEWTPLHRAFRWWLDPHKQNAIQHLLALGADPTAVDGNGLTPIAYVSEACVDAAKAALAEAVVNGWDHARLEFQRWVGPLFQSLRRPVHVHPGPHLLLSTHSADLGTNAEHLC